MSAKPLRGFDRGRHEQSGNRLCPRRLKVAVGSRRFTKRTKSPNILGNYSNAKCANDFRILSLKIQRASRLLRCLNPHRALKDFGDVHDAEGGFLAVDQTGHVHEA
jgi:hypothetical protein